VGHQVRKAVRFCYGHRVAGHPGPCRHLHGHNARVEVECQGEPDGRGMVVDFGEIARVVEGWVKTHWDHRMILQAGDPWVAVLAERGEPFYELDAPPTAEHLAAHLFRVARGAGLPVTAVHFWETETSVAVYREG
jgi:6-pyruvoyltetrahydropterin/6-carboxytetrahydropterin synthase